MVVGRAHEYGGLLLQILDQCIVHAIAEEPESAELQVLAQEMHGAIRKSEVRAAGMPTERAVISFALLGQLIDLIRGEWEASHAPHGAVDFVKRFEHHRAVVAVDASPDREAGG